MRRARAALLLLLLSLASALEPYVGAHIYAAETTTLAARIADSTAVDSALLVQPALEPLVEPPARDYRAEVEANFTRDNRTYSSLKVAMRVFGPLTGILVGLLVLFSGLSARLRDIAHGLGRHRWVRVLVFLGLYSAITFLATLPLAWYDGFALEHQFGLSNQSWAAWFGDQIKGLGISIAVLGVLPLLALAYVLIARAPRTWWLWVGLLALPVIVAGVLLEPLVIDPLFNRFTPLSDRALETRIVSLAERAGIPGRRVVQVDRSAQTRKFNAYVNGFGVSQRIVLWDTTLEGMEEDEILFVTGHEIGHYVLGHIWKGVVLTWGLSLAVLALVAGLGSWAVRRWGENWGFTGLDDVASMPLLALLLTLFGFVAQPLVNGFSRGFENEADVYALEITRDNDAGARAFLKLGSQNRSNPRPSAWVRFVLYSHPTLTERVDRAVGYRPWDEGRPNRYYQGRLP